MFVDKAKIEIKAGDGGNGAVAFHREKYIASGGPDGGDGGRGGNVVIQPDANMNTLMDFRYKRKYVAKNGADGAGKRCSGKDGEDLIIKVPFGTVVRDAATNMVMADMSEGKPFIAAKGGRGGWGNAHFATPTRQAPRFAKAGLQGASREIVLELKLIADVGLVGFPNAGKSTLLAAVSRAKPKIADYHFTTLYPNLGVVANDEGGSFVLADIPGLIEGASEGAGLGYDFLRHIDRCRLLVHVVDISESEGRDTVEDFKTINVELKNYSAELASRPMIVVGNKRDIAENMEASNRLEQYATELGLPYFVISAATHAGLRELTNAIMYKLSELPPPTVFEPEFIEPETELDDSEPEITHDSDVWNVEGSWIERLMENVNFGDYESRMYFDRVLRNRGIYDKLEELGINEGDTVSVCGLEFEYKR